MPAELTLETLAKTIEDTKSAVQTFVAMHDDTDKEKKDAAAKLAMEEEEKKKEAKKAAKTAALKVAMEEKDEEKRDAAIKVAMEMEDKKHEAFGKPDEKTAMEEKEKEEHVASIIEKDRQSMIKQILTAAAITTPDKLKDIESVVKTASISELKKYQLLTPTFEASVPTPQRPEVTIPFFANIDTSVDSKMLTAASPNSSFNTLSTKELLELGQ